MKQIRDILAFTFISILLSCCQLPEDIQVKFAIPPLPPPPTGRVPLEKLLPDEEFLQKYDYYYNKLELDKRLEEFKSDYGKPKITQKEYEEHGEFVIVRVKGPLTMEFNGITGVLLRVENNLIDDFYGKYPVKFDKKKKTPDKTKEEITKEMEKYKEMFLDKELLRKHQLSNPEFEFENRLKSAGEWWLYWRRVLNGYLYNTHAMILQIDEEFGFWSFTVHLRNKTCSTEVKISEATAKKIAWAAVPEITKMIPWLADYNIKDTVECELMIIHPNYTFSPKPPPRDTFDWGRNPEIRLAYHIKFWLRRKRMAEDELWFNDIFYLDIDAATGEIVGGAFPM